MPSPFEQLVKGRPRSNKLESLGDFRRRVFDLERLQASTGAGVVEQDKPGAMRVIVDILSRPNYALAGLTEELLTERSVSGGVARALREIFSGVGDIQGEKRAFGEVLENLGVGTRTLADAFPALEGTWVGAMGSRGAAGISLDILTDPLTYVTFGTASSARVLGGKLGKIAVNKRGLQLRGEIQKRLRPAFEESMAEIVDPQGILRIERRYQEAVEGAFLKEVSDGAGGVAKEFLDDGGIKIAGAPLVKGETLTKMGTQVEANARMVLGPNAVDAVIDGTRGFADGVTDHVRRIFHPFNELARLPPELRDRAIEMRRRFVSSRGSVATRMHKILEDGLTDAKGATIIRPGLGKRFRDLEKQDRHIGRKFYEVREGTKKHRLTATQEEVYQDYVNLHDMMGQTLVHQGVLTEEQLLGGYFFHTYENTADLRTYHWNSDGAGTSTFVKVAERFEKDRTFDAYRESERISRQRNRADKLAHEAEKQAAAREGRAVLATPIYPILRPNYDILGNTQRYIDQYADALARGAWREDMIETFGIDLANPLWKSEAIFEIGTPVLHPANRFYQHDRSLLDKVIVDAKESIRDIDARLYEEAQGVAKGVTKAEQKSLDTLMERVRTLLGVRTGVPGSRAAALKSEEGKLELVRLLTVASKSSSQYAQIVNDIVKAGKRKYLPDVRGSIKVGEIEKSLLPFADVEGVKYGFHKGGWWGDGGVAVPEIIARDIEEVNSKALGVGRAEWDAMLRGYDWLNNMFKLGVYTLWPASAIRDAYSNVFLSGLDIGLGALDPKMHYAAARLVAAVGAPRKMRTSIMNGLKESGEKFVTKQKAEYRLSLLAQQMEDLGVVVPGEVFAELTGDPARIGVLQKTLRKGTHYRGLIENEARAQLWLNWIRRGMTPTEAADRVGQFLFNYGELSSIERELFRRMIPFYTFTRKNITLQARSLMSRPGRVAAQVKPFRGRESENEWMVKWEAEGLKLRLDGDGKTVHMINGIDIPLRNLDTIWAGGFGPTGRRMMGMVTPLIKTPIEVIAGTDFFTGGELKRQYAPTLGRMVENLPVAVKDWMGYKKAFDDAGRPVYTFDGTRYALLVKSWMFSRFFSTTDRQFREYLGDKQIAASMLDIMTGLRAKEVDFTQQQKRVMFRRIKQLEDSLVRRGALSNVKIAFDPANERSQLR